jgi:hypothetical protein
MKRIFHIAVGNAEWEPSTEELDAIKQLFEEAVRSPLSKEVVVTCAGVETMMIEIPDDDTSVVTNKV